MKFIPGLAKNALWVMVAGMLLFPAYAFGSSTLSTGSGSQGWNVDSHKYGLPEGSVYDIIVTFLEWLLLIFGVLAVIAFIVAGVLYLVSMGDDNRMEQAKNAMVASIIGIIVALCGYIALKAITTWLSAGNSVF